MNDSKTALESKTIRSLIIGILAVLAVVGVKLTVTDAQVDAIVEGVGAFVALVAMVGGIVGRKNATAVIVPKGVIDAVGYVTKGTAMQHVPIGVLDRNIEGIGLAGELVYRDAADGKVRLMSTNKEVPDNLWTDKTSGPPTVFYREIPSGPPAPPPKHERGAIFYPIGSTFRLVILSLMLLCVSGCISKAEQVAQREALNQAVQPILEDWEELYTPIATDPSKLPNLFDNETPQDRSNWLDQRRQLKKDYNDTLERLRANDSK